MIGIFATDRSLDGALVDDMRLPRTLLLKARRHMCLSNLSVFLDSDVDRDAMRLVQNRRLGRVDLNSLEVHGGTVALNLRFVRALVRMSELTLSGDHSCIDLARSARAILMNSTLVDCGVRKVGRPRRAGLRLRVERNELVLLSRRALSSFVGLQRRAIGESRTRLNFVRNVIYVPDAEAARKVERLFNKPGVACYGNEIVVLSGEAGRTSNACRRVREAVADDLDEVGELLASTDPEQAPEAGSDDGAWRMPRPGPRLSCSV